MLRNWEKQAQGCFTASGKMGSMQGPLICAGLMAVTVLSSKTAAWEKKL